MKVEFDSTEKPETLRAVAAFALMLAGDIDVPGQLDDAVPAETAKSNVIPFTPAPPVPSNTAHAAATPAVAAAPMAGAVAIPTNAPHVFNAPPNSAYPAPVSPVPPPILNATNATVSTSPTNAPTQSAPIAGAQSAAAIEYDASGLPWDARIHNKGRTKKKDGTWKLQKGLDPIFAQQVVQELIAKKSANAPAPTVSPPVYVPPAPPTMPAPQFPPMLPLSQSGPGPLTPEQEARAAWAGAPPARAVWADAPLPPPAPPANQTVPLPPRAVGMLPELGANFGPMPLPPFPGSTAPAMVPPQPVAAPVPPAPQPGTVGGGNAAMGAAAPASLYKQLIDKLTAATQNRTLNPALVAPTVQRFGVPNMGMLSDPAYEAMLPAISQEFDRLIAGGAPSAP